ncbi:FCD domain-containing protein [Agrobacterium vitis]|uniref:FCD domain-containing protein n=2 Tax=Agrobacterium vitis TaxID=373 RepID=A0A368NKZ9_AGRVI|nr:GntR family transcriptional regulator [Agrobacterium vitis]KAA3507797.1 GntR family transcriptional regulator [Agrobacterium vitis]KAA3522322.1 GntR family transcriptional regulator [Agrobacterium vitis]MCF1480473.1 GntR family transcriptional regulator [Agrobacterium vitis]MUZ75755.1 FCD domain-containing protein [Agrobacterium vitis]MUZ98912.1 FCD domain-containing protein [Agrobacterium vitis]
MMNTLGFETDYEEAEPTLAERTYLRLRDDIITSELAPGTLLRESELMKRLDVGRTPVREAIQRLQHDGFVVISARRGTFVSTIDIHDLTAIYEARARIESWATRLSAERLREFERQEATKLMEELQQASGPMALEDILALDRKIHRFIYRTAKNSYLLNTLDHYHNLSLRILYVFMKRFPVLVPRLEDVLHDQFLMLQAVCAGDADLAEKIAMDHVMSFEREVRKVI